MKKKYFCITELDGGHVATVVAESNEQLTQKVKEACSEHWDADTITVPELDMEDYQYGRKGEVGITINPSTSNLSTDEDELDIAIEICETWLY